MHKMIEYIQRELEEIEQKAAKNRLSMSEIEYADKLAHLSKNLLKTDELMSGGYSGDTYKDGTRHYPMDGAYVGAREEIRRDSRDRYSRADYPIYARDGYAMDNHEIVGQLRDIMNSAPDERTRMEFQTFIKKMEQM